tara:strand:+ start:110 stop:223 length:114 start_codon:yes stop_codon:yes gene_type:complete
MFLFITKLAIREYIKNNIEIEGADGKRNMPVKKDNLP